MHKPLKVSVVLPNFNHGHLIGNALEALLLQSRQIEEIIIIDDGSTDDSVAVIELFLTSHPTIQLIKLEKNSGTNAAVRAAIPKITGDIIYFAAADDVMRPGFIENCVSMLSQNPNAAFCSALADYVDEEGQFIKGPNLPAVRDKKTVLSPNEVRKAIVDYGTWFPWNTAIYRTEKLFEFGGFDQRLGPFSDGFICMILALKYGCCFIPEVYCSARVAENSTSSSVADDPLKAIQMFEFAEQEMRTSYKNIFTEDVILAWSGRWRFSIAQRFLQSPPDLWVSNILLLANGKPSFNKGIIRFLSRAKIATAIEAYLLVCLIPRDILKLRIFKFLTFRWI